MDQERLDIFNIFIKGAAAHLAEADACLGDAPEGDDTLGEDKINRLFRAAHSIKSGAGLLNLDAVRSLAHELEIILHMARTGMIPANKAAVEVLRDGFKAVANLTESEIDCCEPDIAGDLHPLADFSSAVAPEKQREDLALTVDIPLPNGAPPFRENLFSLRQALEDDKRLYLVEYDLIKDVHAKGKTPLDIIDIMESSGLILDCSMPFKAVGSLEDATLETVPLHVLFATIVEPDVIGYLFALDPSRIHPVDTDFLKERPVASESDGSESTAEPSVIVDEQREERQPAPAEDDQGAEDAVRRFGAFELAWENERAVVRPTAPDAGLQKADLQSALLACLELGLDVELDLGEPYCPDMGGLQALVAAAISFAAAGKTLLHRHGPPAALVRAAALCGITEAALDRAGVPPALFKGESALQDLGDASFAGEEHDPRQ